MSTGFKTGEDYTGTPDEITEELSKDFLWRFSICFPTILGLIQFFLIIFVFKYDSPQYYIALNDTNNVS